jgi:hypothetical protein
MEPQGKGRVGSLKVGGTMLNTSQHHKQILDDHIQEDAALKKQEDNDRWIGWFIKNLGSALCRIGLRK